MRFAIVDALSDHLGRSSSGLPSDRLHQILKEAIQVRSLYPAPHRWRGERR